MTEQQARTFLEQIASDTRVKAEIVPTKNRGKRASAVKLLLKTEHLTITIKRLDEWAGVQDAWELVSEAHQAQEESEQNG